MTARRTEHGFTLLELIVAAGILALIAVFSWRGLDTLIREREAIAASQSVIDAMQRSFARVERDALLASDVQLDGGGSMRLVASGASSIDGTSGATVEYRLASGTLIRTVLGVDHGSLVVFDGIAALTMEAWSPDPKGGGAWVLAKGLASESRSAPTAVAAGSAPLRTDAAQPAATPSSGAAAPATPPPGPAVAAATGIRVSLAFADGSRIVRAFIVGGG